MIVWIVVGCLWDQPLNKQCEVRDQPMTELQCKSMAMLMNSSPTQITWAQCIRVENRWNR